MANSLQQIMDAWGNWCAGQYGGNGIRFTELLNYGNHGELDNYHQYQGNAALQAIAYDPQAPAPAVGVVASAVTNYDNETSVQQSVTYQNTITTQRAFTWSVTEAISIGIELSATEGVPAVAQATEKVTTTVSLSSTQGGSYSETQTWQVTEPIVVPPQSSVQATLVVTTQQYNINWSSTCLLTGSVAVWFNDQINFPGGAGMHWLWFIDVRTVFQMCIDHGIIDTSGYQIGGAGVIANASGVFTGGQGVSMTVKAVQGPPVAASRVAGEGQTVEIPLHDGARAIVSAESAAIGPARALEAPMPSR